MLGNRSDFRILTGRDLLIGSRLLYPVELKSKRKATDYDLRRVIRSTTYLYKDLMSVQITSL